MPRIADLDRGNNDVPIGKLAEMLESEKKENRDLDRAGLRDLDGRTESLPGMTRHQRDLNRFMPRDGTPAATKRRRPIADSAPRKLTVYRQRILNKQKTALDRAKVPIRAKVAFRDLIRNSSQIRSINDQLSAATSDVQSLDENTQRTIQRVDRVIRMAEEHTTADNIVYTPVKVPPSVNAGNVQGWLQNNFGDDTEVSFDRYTIATHEMHQSAGGGWRPILEITTRRGAYVGKAPHSNEVDGNAAHILPRGMQLRCTGIKTVPVVGRDGNTYSRTVLQMEDY